MYTGIHIGKGNGTFDVYYNIMTVYYELMLIFVKKCAHFVINVGIRPGKIFKTSLLHVYMC